MSESKKYRDTDLGDGAHVVYIPWEETPWGGTTPKPEGYDEMYAEFGLGPMVEEPEFDEEENERNFRECMRIIQSVTHEQLVDLMGEEWLEEFRRVAQ